MSFLSSSIASLVFYHHTSGLPRCRCNGRFTSLMHCTWTRTESSRASLRAEKHQQATASHPVSNKIRQFFDLNTHIFHLATGHLATLLCSTELCIWLVSSRQVNGKCLRWCEIDGRADAGDAHTCHIHTSLSRDGETCAGQPPVDHTEPKHRLMSATRIPAAHCLAL